MQNKATVAFGLLLAMLLVNAGLSSWSTERLIDHDYWVKHTYEVIGELEGVLADVTTAETSQRGFLLIGPGQKGTEYLEPYHEATARIQSRLKNLRRLTNDNESQKIPIDVLDKEVQTKLAVVERVIALRETKSFEAALAAFRTDAGERQMDTIRATVQAMRTEEEKLLKERTEQAAVSTWVTRLTLWTGAVFSAALLGFAYILIVRDFDRRLRVLDLIREEREWLEVTLHGIGDGVMATDAQGRITLLNPVAEKLTGWSQAEATGRPIAEVFHIINEKTWHVVPNPAEQALQSKTVIGLANHTILIARDGTERPIADSAAPISSRAGVVLGVVLVFRDVSEVRAKDRERERLLAREQEQRARAEASEVKLAEASRRKDNFLALLGHELRNPLAPIRNAVSLLGFADGDAAGIEQAHGMIDRQVRHLTRMVDELLDASRIANGKIQLRLELLDLAELVRAAAEDHRADLEASGLTLEVIVPATPVWVEGDGVRLTQVVSNLLMNCGKFTDAGGRVTVEVAREDDRQRAKVVVRDTGVGMETPLLERLFMPFEQADRSLDRSRGGLGLGLAVVKGLVELHSGKVQATSAGPGKGSEFSFWLPLVAQPAPTSKGSQISSEVNNVLRVLIIEDNKDAADSLRMVLELSGGHEVAVAYAGPEGLALARSLRPDVVLCNLGLPGISGYEVARTLRQDMTTRLTRLIAVSGYGQDEDRRKASTAGFDQFLVKPVEIDALLKLLGETPGPKT